MRLCSCWGPFDYRKICERVQSAAVANGDGPPWCASSKESLSTFRCVFQSQQNPPRFGRSTQPPRNVASSQHQAPSPHRNGGGAGCGKYATRRQCNYGFGELPGFRKVFRRDDLPERLFTISPAFFAANRLGLSTVQAPVSFPFRQTMGLTQIAELRFRTESCRRFGSGRSLAARGA